jgi:hypothetical protein
MRLRVALCAVALAALPASGLAQQQMPAKPPAKDQTQKPAQTPAAHDHAQMPATPASPATPAAKANVRASDYPFDVNVARRATIDDLKAWKEEKKPVAVLDVRGAVSGPMAEGAVHVPVGADLEAWAKDKAKDMLIVAYCT